MNSRNEVLHFKGYVGSAEISHEDGCLIGQILYIDDLVMYEGDTYDELKKAFENSVRDYLELCKRVGKTPQKTYSGSFNIRIGAELHSKAARAAADAGVTLNDFCRNAIASSVSTSGVVRPDEMGVRYWSVAHGASGAIGHADIRSSTVVTAGSSSSTSEYADRRPTSEAENVVAEIRGHSLKLVKAA